MGSEYVKSSVLSRSGSQKQSTGQKLNIADNRSCAVSQAKLIRVIQRAATLTGGQAIPQEIKDLREDTMTTLAGTNDGNDTIYVGGPLGQGFGMNAGIIDGENAIFNISANQNNETPAIHTEPMLISKKYTGAYGDWTTANAAAAGRAVNPDGSSANPFELFTERVPCSSESNCWGNLHNARYKNNDIVKSHFGDGVDVGTVASAYIPQAENKYPDYTFTLRPGMSWQLQGTKKIKSKPLLPPSTKKSPGSDSKKQMTLFDFYKSAK